jgi:prolyl 4-hydroxylase
MLEIGSNITGELADTSMAQNSDDDCTTSTSMTHTASGVEAHSSTLQSSVVSSPVSFNSILPNAFVSSGSSVVPSNSPFYQYPNPAFSQLQLQSSGMLTHAQTANIFDQKQIMPLHHQQQLQQHLFSNINSSPHNLIPFHLQTTQSNVMLNLNGTPGYPPALIPQLLQQQQQQMSYPHNFANNNVSIQSPQSSAVYTVQDRPTVQPMYNGVNLSYPGLRMLNAQPPIFCVDNFLTEFECRFLIEHAQDSFGPAPVVGKGAGEVSPSRTSSTCYLAREDLPDILRKVSILTGKPIEHCELPQVGRYFPSQQYLQHFDAFDVSTEDGRRFALNGGQRTVTVLMYLNTVARGGATRFPALNLDVQPVQGQALIFFPATVDGFLDKMALHAAMPAIDTKYVSQIWIRQAVYTGLPSKRLPQILGVPFGQELSFRSMQLVQQVGVSMLEGKAGETGLPEGHPGESSMQF